MGNTDLFRHVSAGPVASSCKALCEAEGWLPLQAQQRRRWALQGSPFGAQPASQPLRCVFSPYLDTLSKPRLDAGSLAKPETRRIDQCFPWGLRGFLACSRPQRYDAAQGTYLIIARSLA